MKFGCGLLLGLGMTEGTLESMRPRILVRLARANLPEVLRSGDGLTVSVPRHRLRSLVG
jgi:hypothetical protein